MLFLAIKRFVGSPAYLRRAAAVSPSRQTRRRKENDRTVLGFRYRVSRIAFQQKPLPAFAKEKIGVTLPVACFYRFPLSFLIHSCDLAHNNEKNILSHIFLKISFWHGENLFPVAPAKYVPVMRKEFRLDFASHMKQVGLC